jgi:hypothetical protein
VGSYARLQGQTVTTTDLDLLCSPAELEQILDGAPRQGMKVLKRPQPRTVPAAFLDWNGKEINFLTSSQSLRPWTKRVARPGALS